MSKTFFWQAVRLVVMVLAVAGIIYALEFMHGGIAAVSYTHLRAHETG